MVDDRRARRGQRSHANVTSRSDFLRFFAGFTSVRFRASNGRRGSGARLTWCNSVAW